MTALATDRNTPTTPMREYLSGLPIAAAQTIFAGSLVCIDTAGRAVVGTDAAGLYFAGVAQAAYGSAAVVADSVTVHCDCGCSVYLANSAVGAGTTITDAMRGLVCYLEDDQTVARITTNLIPVGVIEDVQAAGPGHAAGVWVRLALPDQLMTKVHGNWAVGVNLTVNKTTHTVGVVTATGLVEANGGLDATLGTGLGTVLALGATTANAIEFAVAGVTTTINGNMVVDEATTYTGAAGFTGLVTCAAGPRIDYATTDTDGPPNQAEMTAGAAFDTDLTGQIGVYFDSHAVTGVNYFCGCCGSATPWFYLPMVIGA
jgi:hypothetical protein